MNPLLLLLVRILNGERLRKQTPEEEREWAGFFLLIAIYFALAAISMRYVKHFWNSAGAFELTTTAAISVCIMWFIPRIWGRHVPAKLPGYWLESLGRCSFCWL